MGAYFVLIFKQLRSASLAVMLLVFFGGIDIYAQQDPIFNKYMFNPLVINPAYAGSRETISTVFIHRSQWVGFKGAPTTQTLSIHAPLAQKKMGIGVGVIRDQLGPSLNYGIHLSGAYRIRMSHGKLSMGLRGVLYNYAFDWAKIEYKDLNQKPIKSSYWLPSFDVGFRYHNKKMYAGLSFSHLNQPTINNSIQGIDSINNPAEIVPHVNITSGYAFALSNRCVFKPSFLVNYSVNHQFAADVNASVLLNNALWLGLSYRTSKIIVAMVQYDMNDKLSLGYSYDLTLSKLINQNSGSHEIFFRYEFEAKKSKQLSPRYF